MDKIYITNDIISNQVLCKLGQVAVSGDGSQALQREVGKEPLAPKMAALFAVMQLILGQTVVAKPTVANLPPGGETEMLGQIKRKLEAQFAVIPNKEALVNGLILGINHWLQNTTGVNKNV